MSGWNVHGEPDLFGEALDSQTTVPSVLHPKYEKVKVRFEYNGARCAWIRGGL